jgi:hypothetical protein
MMMNERLLREYIRIALRRQQSLLVESKWDDKWFADSTTQTGSMRPRLFVMWAKDGYPDHTAADPEKEYYGELDPEQWGDQAFPKAYPKGAEAFSLSSGAELWYETNDGIANSKISGNMQVDLKTFISTDATAIAAEWKKYTDNSQAKDPDPNKTTLGGKPAIWSPTIMALDKGERKLRKAKFTGSQMVRVEHTSGEIPSPAYAVTKDLVHHISAPKGGKTGKIKDQVIGQSIEWAVEYGLDGRHGDKPTKPKDPKVYPEPGVEETDFQKATRTDSRAPDTWSKASPEEKYRFDMLMATAAQAVAAQKGEKFVSGKVATASTATVDVEGQGPDGPVDIHVKFNEKRRLFGLQGPKVQKNEDGSTKRNADGESIKTGGSQATVKYKKYRDDTVKGKVPTREAYAVWVKSQIEDRDLMNDKGELKSEISEHTDLPQNLIIKEGVIQVPPKGTKAPALRYGTKTEISGKPMSNASSADWIDPRCVTSKYDPGKYPTGTSLMLKHDKTFANGIKGEIEGALITDIQKQLTPPKTADGKEKPVYYFNFSGTGAEASLKIDSFSFGGLDTSEDTDKINVSVQIADSPKMGRTFNVFVMAKGVQYNPLYIEITSISRGHPLQAHKTSGSGANASTEKGRGLEELMTALTTEARNRGENIMLNEQDERMIRKWVQGMLNEALSASDEKAIGVIARKEAQKLWDDKWEKKILDIVKKELKDVYKGKEFTDAVVKIHKKAQLAYLRLQWEKGRQFTRYDVSAS